MSDTNSFQFFVMIGGPFWCALLLCFLGDWIYKAFARWRWRHWWRTHQRQGKEKFGSCQGIGMSIPAVFKEAA